MGETSIPTGTSNGTLQYHCPMYLNASTRPAAYRASYIINATVNILLALTAVLGNTVILAALRKTSSLHSPSKVLLSGLALTDLVVGLFCQPLYVSYLLSCAGKKASLVQWSSSVYPLGYILVCISVLTMTAISVDRFLALHLKHRYREVVTLLRVKVIVSTIWIAGGLLGLLRFHNYTTYCVLVAITVAVCILISSLAFVNIYRKLSQQDRRVYHSQKRPTQKTENSFDVLRFRKSVNSTIFIFITLLICYVPFFGVLVAQIGAVRNQSWLTVLVFVQTLVFLNSSLNPFLYCWRISEVRKAVRKTVKQVGCCVSLWKPHREEEEANEKGRSFVAKNRKGGEEEQEENGEEKERGAGGAEEESGKGGAVEREGRRGVGGGQGGAASVEGDVGREGGGGGREAGVGAEGERGKGGGGEGEWGEGRGGAEGGGGTEEGGREAGAESGKGAGEWREGRGARERSRGIEGDEDEVAEKEKKEELEEEEEEAENDADKKNKMKMFAAVALTIRGRVQLLRKLQE